MVGTKFRAQSGNIFEWVVVSEHTIFPNVWKCYPLDKYVPEQPMKEMFIQCFSEEFINKHRI